MYRNGNIFEKSAVNGTIFVYKRDFLKKNNGCIDVKKLVVFHHDDDAFFRLYPKYTNVHEGFFGPHAEDANIHDGFLGSHVEDAKFHHGIFGSHAKDINIPYTVYLKKSEINSILNQQSYCN